MDSSGEVTPPPGLSPGSREAPLNEVLAAGMILMTGWKGECDLIEPDGGSGTIPIEAALIARNIAPAYSKRVRTFEKQPFPSCSFHRDFTSHLFLGYRERESHRFWI